MSNDEFYLDLVGQIQTLRRRLDDLMIPEQGWIPVFLEAPYTNADFNGDSFSDVSSNTIIENTSWSTTIPTSAKALLVGGILRDSGSASTMDLYFVLCPSAGSGAAAFACRPSGKPNDEWYSFQAIVPCTNGDIWYRVNASGTNTMDIYMDCWGYWT